MKNKKAKEQFIALLTFSSICIFFLYLKLNPGISTIQTNNAQNEINEIINDKIEEVLVSETLLSNEKNNILISKEKEIVESIISFTENELKRAKSYLDREWRPDDTINMAAWEYVSKNPNFNFSKK